MTTFCLERPRSPILTSGRAGSRRSASRLSHFKSKWTTCRLCRYSMPARQRGKFLCQRPSLTQSHGQRHHASPSRYFSALFGMCSRLYRHYVTFGKRKHKNIPRETLRLCLQSTTSGRACLGAFWYVHWAHSAGAAQNLHSPIGQCNQGCYVRQSILVRHDVYHESDISAMTHRGRPAGRWRRGGGRRRGRAPPAAAAPLSGCCPTRTPAQKPGCPARRPKAVMLSCARQCGADRVQESCPCDCDQALVLVKLIVVRCLQVCHRQRTYTLRMVRK